MGYLRCYCTLKINEFGYDTVHEVFPNTNNKLCKEWAESYNISNGLILGIGIFVCVINIIICYLVDSLTKFEKLSYMSNESKSGMIKIFITQFINSVLLSFSFRQ